jgi:hypothetical protein
VPLLRRLVADFPPRRPGFEHRSGHVGFVVYKVALGGGFLRVVRLALPILIPPTSPQSPSSIIRGWYNKPNSGRRTKWSQPHPLPPRNTKKNYTPTIYNGFVYFNRWVLRKPRAQQNIRNCMAASIPRYARTSVWALLQNYSEIANRCSSRRNIFRAFLVFSGAPKRFFLPSWEFAGPT